MKKLQKLLAMMLTVVLCVGTIGDAGFKVFAADAEDETAAEEAADEEGTSEETVVPAKEQAEEDEDPVAGEPADDGAVTKLIVNGTSMLGIKAGHFLKPNGEQYSGSIAEAMQKPYMYYDKEEGILQLHDITLDGKYGFLNDGVCSTGIEFAGDKLIVEVIGECLIEQEGVAGEDAYGINADGDLTIRNTQKDEKAVYGSLKIKPASKANWISSIKCTGKLDIINCCDAVGSEAGYEPDEGLTVEAGGYDVVRSVNGAEIDCKGDMIVTYATVRVYPADNATATRGIVCGGGLNIASGYVAVLNMSFKEYNNSVRVAIMAEADINIGADAEVVAISDGDHGTGIGSRKGNIVISGTLAANGKVDAVYANKEVILNGCAVRYPEEGRRSESGKSIVDYYGEYPDQVMIQKGRYSDVWVGGHRLASWDKDLSTFFETDGAGSCTFDAETGTLTLKNISGVKYGGPEGTDISPSAPSEKHAIYVKEPLTIIGENVNIEYDKDIIYAKDATDISLSGNFSFKSKLAAVNSEGGVKIVGGDTVVKAECEGTAIYSGQLNITDAVAEITSNKTVGIISKRSISFNGCDATVNGDSRAILVLSSEEDAITISDDITILEPEGAKITKEGGATFIVDGTSFAKKVHIGKAYVAPKGSALNPVPEGLDVVTALTLVKGQKFKMPSSGWTVAKADKKYVTISKKGKLNAKKATPDGSVVTITNGSRTIDIRVIQPKFESTKPIKMEAKEGAEPVSCGFVVGDDTVPVAYYSSTPDVVAVNDEGMLEAKTYGTSTITAFVNGKAYTRKVKVTEPEPLKEREIHVNLNVSKSITVKGVKISEWTVPDPDKEHVSVKKTKVTAKTAGEYILTGKDKKDNTYKVHLIVDDPEIKEPAFEPDAHKAGTYKYKIKTEPGVSIPLEFASMDQPVFFRSGNGAVAYVDEELRLNPQEHGKCKLTAKINGKTVTISVVVE